MVYNVEKLIQAAIYKKGKKRGPGRPKKGYTKTGKKMGRPKSVSSIKKIVKKEISRNVENKTQNYFNTLANIYPSNSASFIGSVIPVSPYTGYLATVQGTGQGARIGNAIKLKSLSLRGTLFPLPYNATTNPTPTPSKVIFWFFYDRANPTAIPDITTANFLQQGNSSVPLQNSISDAWCPVNNDRYRLLTKRVYKLGFANAGGTGTQASYQSFANNDFKYNIDFKINLLKHVVKSIKYNDNTSAPTNRGLYWMFTIVAANGGNYAASYVPAAMEYSLNMQYEDA